MIKRHAVGYKKENNKYYIMNGDMMFIGYDDFRKPKYSYEVGRSYETEESAAKGAQELNDISCALNQAGGI